VALRLLRKSKLSSLGRTKRSYGKRNELLQAETAIAQNRSYVCKKLFLIIIIKIAERTKEQNQNVKPLKPLSFSNMIIPALFLLQTVQFI
jgi:hypothetical protein